MRLVNDHEVEASGGELLFRTVDLVDHRLVGRKRDAGIGTALQCGVRYDGARIVWQKLHKCVVRLGHQRRAVCKEEYVRHPVLPRKHIDKRYDRPRLARSRGHDEKPRPLLVAQLLADLRDGGDLIVAPGDVAVDLKVNSFE